MPDHAPHYRQTGAGGVNHLSFRTSVPGVQSVGPSGPVSYRGLSYSSLFGERSIAAALSGNGFFGPPGTTVGGGFLGPGGGGRFHRNSFRHHYRLKSGQRLPRAVSLSSSGTISYDAAKNAGLHAAAAKTYTILATYSTTTGAVMHSHTWELRVRIGVVADGGPPTEPVKPSDPPGHPDQGHPSDPSGGGKKPPPRDPGHEPSMPDKNANPRVRVYPGVLHAEPADGLVNTTADEAAEFLATYASDGVFDVKVHDEHPSLRVAHQPKVVTTNFGVRADVHYTTPGLSRNDVRVDPEAGTLTYAGGHGDAEQKSQVEVLAMCHYQDGNGPSARHYTVFSETAVTLQVEGADDPSPAPAPEPAPAGTDDPDASSTHPANAKSTEHHPGDGLQWYAYAGISAGVLVLAALAAWAIIRRRRRSGGG